MLTLGEITAALAQLLQDQHLTRQQIETLLAQQNNPQPVKSPLRATKGDREPMRTRLLARAHMSNIEDVRDIINNRRDAGGKSKTSWLGITRPGAVVILGI